MARGMASTCKESEGASDDEVDEMINKTEPTTMTGKCLNACMMEQFGVVSHDGAHNWVKGENKIKIILPTRLQMEKLTPMVS